MASFSSRTRTVAIMLAVPFALLPFCPTSISTAWPVQAQTAQAPEHPTSTPYSGDLSIFEDKDRDGKLQTGRVLDALKLHPGSVIADIGAGGGWFSVRAALERNGFRFVHRYDFTKGDQNDYFLLFTRR